MTDALALLISGHAFWIGFCAGSVVCGFGALAIGWARFYDAGYSRGWRDHEATHPPRTHNW